MPTDRFGREMTAASQEAADHYSDTIKANLELSKATGDHLKATLSADPELVLGHCLKGYFFKLFAVPALEARARKVHAEAFEIATRTGATERERRHLAALGAWCNGDLDATTDQWEAILIEWPCDMLALRTAHFLHLYKGSIAETRNSIARVLPAWPQGSHCASFVRGMYAYGLEECGDYAQAEAEGRRAVAAHPQDLWAVHAVSHVLEMQGRYRDGIRCIEENEPHWGDANNFAYHLWWHKALYHYERREFDAVLALYDTRFRAEQSDEYLDISNACATLWRLEDWGVDIGDRWVELAERCGGRARDHLVAFADAHYVMALAAGGRWAAADAMIEEMRDLPAGPLHHQSRAIRDVGAPLAEATVAYRRGEFGRVVALLYPIRDQIIRIGGSHAQRDLFALMLIEAALKAGRFALARALTAERIALKPNSALAWAHHAAALKGCGDLDGVARARAGASGTGSVAAEPPAGHDGRPVGTACQGPGRLGPHA